MKFFSQKLYPPSPHRSSQVENNQNATAQDRLEP